MFLVLSVLKPPLPKENLSGLDISSKLASILVDKGFYPSAGAIESMLFSASGFSTDCILEIEGPPLILRRCSSPCEIVLSSSSFVELALSLLFT